jgi:CHASE1-domain containing sensor protein
VSTEATYFVVGLIFSALFLWNFVMTVQLRQTRAALRQATTALVGISLGEIKVNVNEETKIISIEEK